jgi:hypothetical protein
MDNPDVGTIILHRLGKVDGLDQRCRRWRQNACKAYEKGVVAMNKRNPEELRKISRKPELYPSIDGLFDSPDS